MVLPVNIDTAYADDGADASVKVHQQHHDVIHRKLSVTYDVVADYGAVGNGTTDDATVFNSCSTAAAGVGVVVIPPGTYAMGAAWDLPSNTTIYGYGATLKATSTDANTRVITATNKSNIKIYGLAIDGDKAGFAGVTEQRHGIYLVGCANVTLVDVASNTNKGDGLYLGRGISPTVPCSNINVARGTFDANHRNALSVIDCVGGRFLDCDFTNTTGTAPQDGVDIEPNVTANAITDLVFTRCKMTGNTGDGMAFNRLSGAITPDVARIKVADCQIKNNGLRGVIVSWASPTASLDFLDTDVEGSGRFGYSIEPTANTGDVKILGGSVRTNQWAGIQLKPVTAVTLSRVLIEGVSVIDNSVVGATTYDGIWVYSRSVRVTIAACVIANVAAANQGVPIWSVDTTVTNLKLIGNTYQTVNPVLLTDDASTRTDLANGTVGTVTDLSTVTPNIRTASYTLALADAGKLVEMNVAGANTLTVPPNSSVAFPTNTWIHIRQYGAGVTTVTQGAGVTVRAPGGLAAPAQYREGRLTKRSTDEWVLAWLG